MIRELTYYVDGVEYKTHYGSLTGFQIVAMLPGYDPRGTLETGSPSRSVGMCERVSFVRPIEMYTCPPCGYSHKYIG